MAERQAIARKMLADGASVKAIQAATRLATGVAVGGSTLTRLRRHMKKSAASKQAAATRAKRRSTPRPAEAPPETRVAGTHLGALVGVTEALDGLTPAQALKVLRMAAAYVGASPGE